MYITPTGRHGELWKLESAGCDGTHTILQLTLCLFGIASIVVLSYLPLSGPLQSAQVISW
jgi:hypothetical protein